MTHLKRFGVALIAISALVGASNASATTVTSPTGTVYTGEIKGETKGHGVLDSPVGEIKCRVGVEGKIEAHGASTTASGTGVGNLLEACTEGWHKTTISSGSIEAHWTSGYNGVITSTGAEVMTTIGGITCVLATSNTQIGTVTGGSPAVLDIEAKIPVNTSKSSIFCGTQAMSLTGSGVVTTPSPLYLDK